MNDDDKIDRKARILLEKSESTNLSVTVTLSLAELNGILASCNTCVQSGLSGWAGELVLRTMSKLRQAREEQLGERAHFRADTN